MSQILDKGETYRLDANLAKIRVGFGWKLRDPQVDLDTSCLMLAKNDQVRSDADVIFYHQLSSPCKAVQLLGGRGICADDAEFDDEEFDVDLAKVPNDVAKLLFVVTIYDANGPTLDKIDDVYMRGVNLATDEEIFRHRLPKGGYGESLLFGEFVKENGGWTFRALSQDFPGDLRALLVSYGVNVDD